MDALETLVRDVLHEHAADAPTEVPNVRERAPRRWLYGGLAAAAVVAVAVALVAVRDAGTPAPSSDGSSPAGRSTSSPVPVPDGYRRIGYHGLTLVVPANLPTNTTGCALPREYVVAADPNVQYDCVEDRFSASEQTLTVTLTTADTASPIATQETVIGGQPARIGYGTLPPYPGVAGQAIFPGADVAVIVTAPDHGTVETVLTSVAQGADPLGCPAQRNDPANARADTLVPGDPTGAVRCIYTLTSTASWLVASMQVQPEALPGLVAAINGLPSGDASGVPPTEMDLLRFDYTDGSSRTLRVEMNAPTSYSDGTRTGYDDNNVVTDQLRTATR